MAKIYQLADLDADLIRQRSVGMLGYGSQGRAQALNLRDSGVEVRVGARIGGASWNAAIEDGFAPQDLGSIAAGSDVVVFALPDVTMGAIYASEIRENLRSDATLIFAHGFSVHYGFLVPPESCDVALVAPNAPGAGLRSAYLAGSGTPGLVAARQDPSGQCLAVALSYGWACGCRQGMLETTFGDETETDLFAEQVVLCGGIPELIRGAFDTLVEAGYEPEIAYITCLHEVKLIVDSIVARGLSGMRHSISGTAAFGGLATGPEVISAESRSAMRDALGAIQDGSFATRWMAEFEHPKQFEAMKRAEAESAIERVGADLRKRLLGG